MALVFPNLASTISEETQGIYSFVHRDVGGYNTLYLEKSGVVIMYDMAQRPLKDVYESNLENLVGDVLICGLGVGFSVFPIKDLPAVDSVTVIENDATIISMMTPYLSGVTIINADANTYVPTQKYDAIFLDIWDDNNVIEKYSHTLRYQTFLKGGGFINYLDFDKYYTIQPSYSQEDVMPEKTNAEMLAIANPTKGDKVWNTTWNMEYYFEGDVWLTEQLVKRVNKDTSSMVEGNPVYQDIASDDGCLLSNNPGHIAIYGIVKDVYGGGDTDDFVTVAIVGDHNVLCTGTVVRNEVLSQSNTEGVAVSSGVGGTGDFAVTSGERSGTGNSLVLSIVQPTERY